MAAQTPTSTAGRSLLPLGIAGCGALALAGLCLAAVAVGIVLLRRGQPTAVEPTVEYILDTSPRMNEPAEGGTRLSVAQAALAEIVRPSDPTLTAALRVFGSGSVGEPCQDTDLVVPLGRANQPLISRELSVLEAGPEPDSALAEALIAAIRDLAATRGPHSLVVVTGGADSCSPQADQLIAQEAQRAGIDLQLFVIGYQVAAGEVQAVKVLADSTPGGMYLGVEDSTTLRTVLAAVQAHLDAPSPTSLAAVTAAATPSRIAPAPDVATYAQQTACDHPYFPLRAGAQWVYSTGGGFAWTQAVADVSGDLVEARAIVTIDTPWSKVSQEWTCSPEGLILELATYAHQDPADTQYAVLQSVWRSGPKLIPADQLVAGTTWNSARAYQWDTGQTVDWSTALAVQSAGSLTVPAGVFYTVRVNETSTTPALPGGSTSSTIWYAYAVGPVSITNVLSDGRVATVALKSYSAP